ncbi:hypothetical protein SAMN05444266_101274 [Chitinophaga jiangningensis]|uniref:Uncharacterized protein n=1 Tax=Chitinophaga jiangningensis TaxID=1419482 RepID=A0A1M6VMT2_9BACT|nr:hypothetical protein [Chitinophaga jiangningensis]SHK82645.1 hypothetical protein SAMN05444266_101274 [Chitinophaga jiangningensis]
MYNVKFPGSFLLLLVLLLSCRDKHTPLITVIRNLDTHPMKNGVYVVIPNQGCDGCISSAEVFVKTNVQSSPYIKYIFTKIQSTKMLRIKLGGDVIDDAHILLDTTNNIVYPDSDREIYPMIVYVKNNEITAVKYQRPGEEGLEELSRVMPVGE